MPAIDNNSGQAAAGSVPCRKVYAVTPSDSAELTEVCRVLYAAGAGNVVLVTAAGDQITLAVAAGGVIDWVQFKQVRSTSTTATGILAGV